MQCAPQIIFEFIDFPQLPLIVPICNSVSFSKSIVTVFSTSSVHRGKPIWDSNVSPSKPVSASFVRRIKPISNRNVRLSETVIASSVSVIFCSSALASKPIRCINVRVSKPISEHVGVCGVCDVRPSEPISISHARFHARSSNIDSARNIHPSKTVSASNVCPGKPVYTNYVRQSRSNCKSMVFQSEPTSDSNIRDKPIRPNHICLINSLVSTQQIQFIFLLSLLAFPVYYKYSIFKTNIFYQFFLVIIILLTKLTCFRKFFILYISQSSAFLRCNLNTCIVFQAFRAILLLNTSEVSFYTKGSCIFAILNIIAFNFPKSNVQRKVFQNTFKKVGNVLRIFTFILFILVIWQFNAFCMTVFLSVIVTVTLALAFIVFTILFLIMFIKLFYIIGILKHFSIIICISFLHIIFRIFYYFMFGCFFFLVFALLLCLFVNVLHGFRLFTYFNDYNSSKDSTFSHIHANVNKEANFFSK